MPILTFIPLFLLFFVIIILMPILILLSHYFNFLSHNCDLFIHNYVVNFDFVSNFFLPILTLVSQFLHFAIIMVLC